MRGDGVEAVVGLDAGHTGQLPFQPGRLGLDRGEQPLAGLGLGLVASPLKASEQQRRRRVYLDHLVGAGAIEAAVAELGLVVA